MHLGGQALDQVPVVRLAKIPSKTLDDCIANLAECVHLMARVGVTVSKVHARIVERRPRAIAAGQKPRRGLAYMPDTERMDEAIERDDAASADRAEEFAHRPCSVALALFELDAPVSGLEREDVR